MKVRFPLYAQTISFLLLHLILLLVLFLFLFNTQFGPGWDALLASPVGERVETIGWLVQKQLDAHPESEWNVILDEFGKLYGVKFYLIDIKGQQLAGEPIKLPDVVAQQCIRRHHPPPPPAEGRHPFSAQDLPGALPGPDAPPSGTAPGLDAPSGTAPGLDAPPPADVGPQGEPLPAGAAHPDASSPAPAPQAADTSHALASQTMPPAKQSLTPPGPTSADRHRFRRTYGRFLLHTSKPDRFWIGVRVPIRRQNDERVVPGTLVASATNLWKTGVFFDFGPVLVLIASILGLSVIFWWPFAYRITRRLTELTAATEKIAEGRFDTTVKENEWDELGSLGDAVNRMAKRLNTFVTGQKRFLGDIAHELCSPMARLQVALELLESSGTSEQDSLIKDIREEVDEMSNLINELLAFSKAGLQGKEIQLEPVNLKELVNAAAIKMCSETLVTVDIEEGIWVMGDLLLLDRAFGNILRNAVRYAADFGPINVRATSNAREVTVTTTDCGPGVPPDAVGQLGEPFFRPEASRSRNSGGVGLGLAIVKTCVESCKGTFLVRNRQPKGLEVEIKLQSAIQTATPLVSGQPQESPQ